ncbi:ATP-binding protein [Halococcus dombrowskii]|uniref:ATP-binding protein n=1 Tax=Halococcus dombrowskii TaxID=179637 RepID=A0AAV3SAG8_HALDO|nr:ATP-binding protein [Halococcus dombrowskii]UOO94286.1 ATP-binding protein [Halococcus dombrowskii]
MSDVPEPPTGRGMDAASETVVGTVAEPGERADEFVFVAPDAVDVRTGEFVVYETTAEGDSCDVLARVTNAEQERGLPGEFLADPGVEPEAVADALGVPSGDVEIDRVSARVVGYFDTEMETFANPRSLPDPGSRVALASDEFLEAVLPSADWESESATAHVGWLLNRETKAANVFMPIDAFAATHLAVLASTGSGKSYTASVVIEEMLRPQSRAAMLVFDPHGEYDTLDGMREDGNASVFQDGAYTPEVNVVTPDEITVAIPDLNYGDLLALLDEPSERMKELLDRAWRELQKESNEIGVRDIISKCEALDEGDHGTASALAWRLNRALNRDLFASAARNDLTDLVAPGQVTVLQLNRLSEDDQQMLAAALLRKLYEARKNAMRGDGDDLDFPLFTLLEEGHRFAPDGSARSLPILRTILSEGRKFGFGVGIISQRPSKLDADVLSQCGTQIIMQIQNPNDQQAIRQSVESAGEDVLDELPGLTPGQAVIAGDAMNTPVLTRIRERHTQHGAESLDATSEWRGSWQEWHEEQNRDVVDPYESDEEVDETPL